MPCSSNINDRISDILIHYRLSETALSKLIGMVQKTVNLQIKGKSSLSASLLCSIAAQFPDISMEWLIRGNGPMFLSNTSEPAAPIVPNPPIGQPLPTESDALASAMELVQKQNEFIAHQAAIITQLKLQLFQK